LNIYSNRSRWKILLLLAAIAIGMGSLFYTHKLVDNLADEERKKVKLWAEATRQIVQSAEGNEFLIEVIKNNETVPVVVLDNNDNVLYFRNLDSVKITNPKYIHKVLDDMKSYAKPIIIDLPENQQQFIYYTRSILLTKLMYYPYVQLGIIFLFVLVSYLAFSSTRKAEQNQVWVGLSKETAHQLGTPISSLLAWTEILKENENSEIIHEFEKDVNRLEKITERFSKIGSQPKLQNQDVSKVLANAIDYMRSRVSGKIVFIMKTPSLKETKVPLNTELFEWVIENLCKNAVDAMGDEGEIMVETKEIEKHVHIDITDTGRGIPKNKLKTIFKPGYTTKTRGWGLGLSLARRIIEEYHAGKIMVLHSEIGKGTTFRITLNKAL
jgi:signal transduction histidine kinase